jgi:hypothetical protein
MPYPCTGLNILTAQTEEALRTRAAVTCSRTVHPFSILSVHFVVKRTESLEYSYAIWNHRNLYTLYLSTTRNNFQSLPIFMWRRISFLDFKEITLSGKRSGQDVAVPIGRGAECCFIHFAIFYSPAAYFDHLCGLVVRVLGYRSRGRGSIPNATRFSEFVSTAEVLLERKGRRFGLKKTRLWP